MPAEGSGKAFLTRLLDKVGAADFLTDPHHNQFLTFPQAQQLLLLYSLDQKVIGRRFLDYSADAQREREAETAKMMLQVSGQGHHGLSLARAAIEGPGSPSSAPSFRHG